MYVSHSDLVIFLLVWDFYWRLFSLFLEPFLGTKKSPFLTPFAQPNQWENYNSDYPKQTWGLQVKLTQHWQSCEKEKHKRAGGTKFIWHFETLRCIYPAGPYFPKLDPGTSFFCPVVKFRKGDLCGRFARARLGEPQKVCASGARANLLRWGQILLRTSPTCFSGLCFLPLYFFCAGVKFWESMGLQDIYIYMYITHIYAYVHILYYIYIIYIYTIYTLYK